jgi:hypothetical protein
MTDKNAPAGAFFRGMRRPRQGIVAWAGLLAIALPVPAGESPAAGGKVRARFGADGLESLSVVGCRDGQSLIESAEIDVDRVQLADEYIDKNKLDHQKQLKLPAAKDPYSGYAPNYTEGATEPTARRFGAEANRLVRTYPWGRVGTAWTVEGNRLKLTIDVSNGSKQAIEFLSINPVLRLRLAGEVKADRGHHNVGAPTVIGITHGEGTVALVNEGVERPLRLSAGVRKGVVTVALRSGFASGGREVYDGEWVTRPIAPGAKDQYTISLRFGGPDADKVSLARDVYERFAEAHPRTLRWYDRRPVGNAFLSGGNRQCPGNPRGWNFVPKDADLSTPEGKKAFREGLMAAADRMIGQMHAKGLQGVIIWDLESATHGTTHYMGTPRFLPVLAPLMNAYADEMFRRLSDAGLRTGITIRPLLCWPVDKDKKRVASWDSPERAGVRHRNWTRFEEVRHPQLAQFDVEVAEAQSPVLRLSNKIAYAKKRWGCSLFYVDTPHFWRPRDRSRDNWNWKSRHLSAKVFRELNRRHPDVLIIPEHSYPEYWAYTAPYHQLGYSPWRTRDSIRAMYPESFVVQNVSNKLDPVRENADVFAEALVDGDTWLVHGWWGGQGKVLRQVYAAAAKEAPHAVRIEADGDLVLNGRKMKDAGALTHSLRSEVRGKPLRRRRVMLTYEQEASAKVRKEVIAAVGQAGAILAWSRPVE